MKDLDFDELDRAVSSLMANVPKTAPRTDDVKEKTLSIDSTLSSDDAPSFSKVEETAAQAADEAAGVPVPKPADVVDTPQQAAPAAHAAAVHARPQPSAASLGRRGGRFMDVVHPSADMKKPDAPRPVSRQAATIEPLNSSAQKIADIVPQKKAKVPEDEKVEKPATEEKVVPEEEAVVPAVQAPTTPAPDDEPVKTEEPSLSSDWPDPLDMAKPTEPETKEGVEAAVPTDQETPLATEEPVPSPLTSPFLPDTKVEKRPLGSLAPEEDSEVEEPSRPPVMANDETPKTIDDPNAQLPADPNAVDVQLPEELSGDLMAVEADTTHDEIKQAHESKIGGSSTPKGEDADASDVKAPIATTTEEPAAPAGPTSIPQQYREEPSTGDKDNGAIYDTDTYHQPLSHPAKKKSGWLWVVWIVAILLLGAGGGAALYFLGIV